MKVELELKQFKEIFDLFTPEEQIYFFKTIDFVDESWLNYEAIYQILVEMDKAVDFSKVRLSTTKSLIDLYIRKGPDDLLDKIPPEALSGLSLDIWSSPKKEEIERYKKLIRKCLDNACKATLRYFPDVLGPLTLGRLPDRSWWEKVNKAITKMEWYITVLVGGGYYASLEVNKKLGSYINPVVEKEILKRIQWEEQNSYPNKDVIRVINRFIVEKFKESVETRQFLLTSFIKHLAHNKRYLGKETGWAKEHVDDFLAWLSIYMNLPENHPIFYYVSREDLEELLSWFGKKNRR